MIGTTVCLSLYYFLIVFFHSFLFFFFFVLPSLSLVLLSDSSPEGEKKHMYICCIEEIISMQDDRKKSSVPDSFLLVSRSAHFHMNNKYTYVQNSYRKSREFFFFFVFSRLHLLFYFSSICLTTVNTSAICAFLSTHNHFSLPIVFSLPTKEWIFSDLMLLD